MYTILRYAHDVCDLQRHQFRLVFLVMPLPATDRCSVGIMFLGCSSLSVCVRPGVYPATTISYKPLDGILPNFGWCSWGDRWTDYVLKVTGSESRSRQGQTFEWVIAACVKVSSSFVEVFDDVCQNNLILEWFVVVVIIAVFNCISETSVWLDLEFCDTVKLFAATSSWTSAITCSRYTLYLQTNGP